MKLFVHRPIPITKAAIITHDEHLNVRCRWIVAQPTKQFWEIRSQFPHDALQLVGASLAVAVDVNACGMIADQHLSFWKSP